MGCWSSTTPERETIADLAQLTNAEVVVAVLPNLGTLNQTALTIEALEQRDLRLAGVVIGRWPKQPDMICANNIVDLETIAKRPPSGAIPRERAGHLSKPEFLSAADASTYPRPSAGISMRQTFGSDSNIGGKCDHGHFGPSP